MALAAHCRFCGRCSRKREPRWPSPTLSYVCSVLCRAGEGKHAHAHVASAHHNCGPIGHGARGGPGVRLGARRAGGHRPGSNPGRRSTRTGEPQLGARDAPSRASRAFFSSSSRRSDACTRAARSAERISSHTGASVGPCQPGGPARARRTAAGPLCGCARNTNHCPFRALGALCGGQTNGACRQGGGVQGEGEGEGGGGGGGRAASDSIDASISPVSRRSCE